MKGRKKEVAGQSALRTRVCYQCAVAVCWAVSDPDAVATDQVVCASCLEKMLARYKGPIDIQARK